MSAPASQYGVKCQCGRSTAVTKADAGGEVQCQCGERVRVPRLSDLRRQAGQAAYEIGPVDRIRRLIAEGQLPQAKICHVSLRPTTDVLLVTVECETPYTRGGYSWWWYLLFVMVSPFLAILAARQDTETAGRETVLRLPLSIDAEFQPEVRQYSAARLRIMLRADPNYSQLLDEFPRAKVYIR